MTYQVLARKWRPQDFSSLVGQEHVVKALGNALAEERIAQAYLFSGIRGVGKTTAARVLAKALNCERGPAANPCNECSSCQEITSGNSLDVVEVDAATYSKVEQVRELTETLRYAPARGRYKVVVLDEVHRLSRQAFDALLKIVEEPPPHLVFIFATTEIDAVPATILSRCQEFQFRRVTQPVLAAHLRTISDAENISASDPALRMIARAGEGSVRDSVALLDQMATFGSGAISDEDAQRVLGGLDTAIFQHLLVAVLKGERMDIVATVRDIEANGWDPHNVYSQFLTFMRDAMHVALSGSGDSSDLPAEEAALLRENLKGHGYEALLQILQLLITSEPTVRRSEFSLLALEVAWLRAAELPKVARLQDLLSGHTAPGNAGDLGSGPRTNPSDSSGGSHSGAVARSAGAPPKTLEGSSSETDIESPTRQVAARTSTAKRPVKRPVVASDTFDAAPAQVVEEVQYSSPAEQTCDPARIPAFLELLGNRRQSLAAHLERAGLRFDRRCLLIAAPKGDSLFENALRRSSSTETLLEALTQVWGDGVTWKLDLKGAPPPERKAEFLTPKPEPVDPARSKGHSPEPPKEPQRMTSSSPPSSSEPMHPTSWDSAPPWVGGDNIDGPKVSTEQAAAVSDLPVVRYILSTFGGKIQSVEATSEESPL